jgi:hypothetical protein
MPSLYRLCKNATKIVVVSAYYDHAFLTDLIAGIPIVRRKSVALTVFVHGFSGTRLQQDLDVLRSWREEQSLKETTIRFVTKGSLFHSKLLVFESKDAATVLIGSANATSAAYQENEEVMLSLEGRTLHSGIRDYLACLVDDSKPLDEVVEPKVDSLIAFFRTGDIYYKPNSLPLFRFDLRLPEGLRDKLSTLRQPIPGFAAKTSRTYNPFPEAEHVEDDAAGTRMSMRPYAAQTCFGWWAPRAYHEQLNKTISAASAKKEQELRSISQQFKEGIASKQIRRRAESSFTLLKEVAMQNGEQLTESDEERLIRFDKFVERCTDQLDNKRWFDRATRVYQHSPMPELWADPVARAEFEDSFFDYLQYVNAAPTEPTLLKSLRKAGIGSADEADKIRQKLTAHLRLKGWSDDDWKESQRSKAKVIGSLPLKRSPRPHNVTRA